MDDGGEADNDRCLHSRRSEDICASEVRNVVCDLQHNIITHQRLSRRHESFQNY